MSTTAKKSGQTQFETKVTPYERVSSMLVALVVLCGLVAAIMFVLWMARNISFDKHLPTITALNEIGEGDPAEGVSDDFEEPGVEELADVPEPQLTDAVEALTDAVSSVAARFSDFDGTAELMGTGTGLGDSRASGPGGKGGLKGRPEWLRWKLNYITSSKKAYAQQLDFFEIELASYHKSLDTIDYAKNLSQAVPTSRSGVRAKEKGRVAFSWKQSSQLRTFDVALLNAAGVATDGSRMIIQLLPGALRQQLLDLEKASLDRQTPKRTFDQVLHTYFGVRKGGAGYEFFVENHDFL